MKKITAALMASVFAVTITAPARAGDAERLLFDIGMAVVGEGIKALNNRPKSPKTTKQQKSAPAARSQQSAPRAQAAAPRPARVPDENIRTAQQKLLDLGYTEVGSADGFGGSNTSKAIGLFMTDNAISGDQKVTPDLLIALGSAKTRQEIAAAKTSAIAEATMPAATVEDGIVHFSPKPEDLAADAEHIAAEEAVEPEDFTDDDVTPSVADATPMAPAIEQKVPVPADVVETAAIPTAPKEEPEVVVAAEPVIAEPAAEAVAVVKPKATEEENADADGVRKVNGLTVSGNF
ncbi:peptidoglycan-binding domain-containing protein [Mesorhizobium sp. A623]